MTSMRLKAVYNSKKWRTEVRSEVLRRCHFRCESTRLNVFGEYDRCRTVDIVAGGDKSLLIDHIDPFHPDPYDIDNLQALCPKCSGEKDGGRRRS